LSFKEFRKAKVGKDAQRKGIKRAFSAAKWLLSLPLMLDESNQGVHGELAHWSTDRVKTRVDMWGTDRKAWHGTAWQSMVIQAWNGILDD
jgi:hypothetical protein